MNKLFPRLALSPDAVYAKESIAYRAALIAFSVGIHLVLVGGLLMRLWSRDTSQPPEIIRLTLNLDVSDVAAETSRPSLRQPISTPEVPVVPPLSDIPAFVEMQSEWLIPDWPEALDLPEAPVVPLLPEVTALISPIEPPAPDILSPPELEPAEETGGSTGIVQMPIGRDRVITPEYPKKAQKEGREGSVRLRVTVSPSGTVSHVDVERSSGHADLDEAAIKAVQQARFHPALHNGKPVEGLALQTIQFRLGGRK